MRSGLLKTAIGCLQTLTALFCLSMASHAQVASVTTSLLGRIDGNQVKSGATFFVKAITEWKQGTCRLKNGDTLEGRVVSAQRRSPEHKRAEMQLQFLPVNCSGDDLHEMVPVLVALEANQLRSNGGSELGWTRRIAWRGGSTALAHRRGARTLRRQAVAANADH